MGAEEALPGKICLSRENSSAKPTSNNTVRPKISQASS